MRKAITFLLSFLYPHTLEKVYSPINKTIVVEKYFGQNRMVVDGFWQSGKYAERNTYLCLRNLPLDKRSEKNILFLGLGGGSGIKIINRLYPKAQIIGVDIDPVMVEMGRKYFDLKEAKNFKITISDAFEFVKKFPKNKYFDIVLTDLYIGCVVPPSTQQLTYLNEVKRILKDDGVYTINGSHTRENIKITDKFVEKMKKVFAKVELMHHPPNMIIRGYNHAVGTRMRA